MPDHLDLVQERVLEAQQALQDRARLEDVPAPASRDCSSCGEPIDPRRLQAWPRAVRCIHCEQLHERRGA